MLVCYFITFPLNGEKTNWILDCFLSAFQIYGIIFDSSPGDRRFLSLYRAVSSIYGKERRFGCIISAFIALGLAAKWVAEVKEIRFFFFFE